MPKWKPWNILLWQLPTKANNLPLWPKKPWLNPSKFRSQQIFQAIYLRRLTRFRRKVVVETKRLIFSWKKFFQFGQHLHNHQWNCQHRLDQYLIFLYPFDDNTNTNTLLICLMSFWSWTICLPRSVCCISRVLNQMSVSVTVSLQCICFNLFSFEVFMFDVHVTQSLFL